MQPGEWGAKLTEIRFHKEKTKRILKLKKEVWKAWTFVGMFFNSLSNSSFLLGLVWLPLAVRLLTGYYRSAQPKQQYAPCEL